MSFTVDSSVSMRRIHASGSVDESEDVDLPRCEPAPTDAAKPAQLKEREDEPQDQGAPTREKLW